MTQGAIMGFPTTDITIGTTNNGFIIDNRFGNVYQVDEADGAAKGLRKWDAFPNGIELRARNGTDLGVASFFTQQCRTYLSQELITSYTASNSALLNGFKLTDMSLYSSFGAVSADLSPSSTYRILMPQQMCAFSTQGTDFVVTATGSSSSEVNCINWSKKLNTRLSITQNYALVGSAPDGSGSNAFALGYKGSGDSTPCGLYTVGLSGFNGVPVATSIGTVSPTQVDATWTNFNGVAGVTVDQTDGNVIVGFSTLDSVTHRARLVKLNAQTAAVMWSVAVAGNPGGLSYGINDMPQNLVVNGTLYYLDSPTNTFYTINTKTGASSSMLVGSLAVDSTHGAQISEDASGSLFVWGSWSEVSFHPAYIGNYCFTLGNHSGSEMGWRFFPNTPPAQIQYAIPIQSRRRSWSFTLDGHTFYVLDLGGQGTFLFDITTRQWCKFITAGNLTWNVSCGTMWGNRIVGGDIATSQLWELQPGALMDNGGALDIVRTVTGGLSKRVRVYSSVAAVRVNASFGDVDDSVTATLTLRFSDDQGNTWSPYFTLNLTAGNFSQELAYRSLGAFAAPGRIFELQDTGGLFRIDGVDCQLDNFDEDTPPPQGGG